MISIIIRTKNEERWISACLKGVFNQKYRDIEVILVDNKSSDRTVEKASQFKLVKVIGCDEYLPGKILNAGVRESRGEYIVCLSGHCIPVNDMWLSNLLSNFDADDVAGVYGRQEPLSFTSDYDKRDLALIFGLDKKIQKKDSFFHNANSMIKRSVWDNIPFDERITNIEDRVWARQALEKGYRIIYEPEARIYHYHGIHQNKDKDRCINVVRIMEDMNLNGNNRDNHLDIENMNIAALIPVKGNVNYLNRRPAVEYTIRAALESKYIKSTIVSTDNPEMAALAKELGAEVPFLRDKSLSEDFIDIKKVYQFSLEKLEGSGIYPDLIAALEVTFPFRHKDMIDNMILQLVRNGLDSIMAAKRENKTIWKQKKDGHIDQIDEGVTPRKFKDPAFIELRGLCCITHPEFIRSGDLYGSKTGIYELDNPFSWIEVRSKEEFKMAELLIKDWKN